jgi:hypothetical protein
MARRLTVSIPDDLAQRLDAHKQTLSPSEVMQSALYSAIEAIEAPNDYGLSLAVRRLVDDLNAHRLMREVGLLSVRRTPREAEQAQVAFQIGAHYLPDLVAIAADNDADLSSVLLYAAGQLLAVHRAYLEQLEPAGAAAGG